MFRLAGIQVCASASPKSKNGTTVSAASSLPVWVSVSAPIVRAISLTREDTYELERLNSAVASRRSEIGRIVVLLKDEEDLKYAKQLLTKTLLKNVELEKEIEGKTPNWDKDRIADIDSILLKMAICELMNFPSIPEKVTINEFLEIAKEYSTPKSSIFINGILDKLVKEYKKEGRLNKMGRGLL